MTAEPDRTTGPSETGHSQAAEPGDKLPRAFTTEIRAAVRYEGGLVVKAAVVLALLAVILLLRQLYLTLPGGRT